MDRRPDRYDIIQAIRDQATDHQVASLIWLGEQDELNDPPMHPGETHLVHWLGRLRSAAGLSYEQMSRASRKRGICISTSTFRRAGAGACWMSERTAVIFAEVCGGSADEARRWWAQARKDRALWVLHAPRGRGPKTVRTRGQFAAELRRMHARAGAPTLRQLETLGGRDHLGRHRLPRTGVSLALRKRGARLPSLSMLWAFLEVCGVHESQARKWLVARQRLTLAKEPPDTTPR